MPALCVGPLCAEQPRVQPAATGHRLCASCRTRLASHLDRLPELYRKCETILADRRIRGVERVRGGLPGGISLNDAAATVRSELLSVLASWAGLVVGERRLAQPPRREIGSLAGFLLRHLDWLARHPAAGDAAAEIAGLVRAAEGAISPGAATRVELGPCDQPGCAGVVSATVRGGRETKPVQVGCTAGHVWPPHRWLLLQHRLGQPGSGE